MFKIGNFKNKKKKKILIYEFVKQIQIKRLIFRNKRRKIMIFRNM